ncbi:MAG: exo-beta-N-acetylmuramidase NamZ family protein [Flavobacteriaceae bacterium]
MPKNKILFFLILSIYSFAQQSAINKALVVGANQTEKYVYKLNNKSIGIVANQTSVIFNEDGSYSHLIDSLLKLKINIKRVFAPEHGFRGDADAGEYVNNGSDKKTGLPIISLYGKNKKPAVNYLKDIDIMIFDIQDVGVRFYTYISSLHYIMEACAEQKIPLIILDRPNPNGDYIDGPVLDLKYKSFVGMHPVPIVHGMTVGEYAKMINGELWLSDELHCDLTVIKVTNYSHSTIYEPPIPPSPNLPNYKSIRLYPSLCLFEGTSISVGRGTDDQFQVYGSPELNPMIYKYRFKPLPNKGAKYPKYQNKLCFGENLKNSKINKGIQLNFILKAYENSKNKSQFFDDFFIKLSGNHILMNDIKIGFKELDIKKKWSKAIKSYNKMRQSYLLYPL